MLKESICIAFKVKKDEEVDVDKEFEGMIGGDNVDSGGGGGGGAGDSGSSDFDEVYGGRLKGSIKVDSLLVVDDVVRYEVKLYQVGEGDLHGSGKYPENRVVTCIAMEVFGYTYFDRWTGDLYRHQPVTSFRIEKDVEATAYFVSHGDTSAIYKRPCVDGETSVGNPLKDMRVAAPSPWSGLRGGTYGYVRSSGKKYHSGLDLYAVEGTPLFAMIDGYLDSRYVVSQPNRIAPGKYPEGYNSDTNDAGNRIYLIGTHDGQTVKLGYWHLMAGNATAINPRTGNPYKPGDKVYRGELLAYSGIIGNAHNVPEPHLHLTYDVLEGGAFRRHNPEEIINGKVDWDSTMKTVLSAVVRNIQCDSENSYYPNL